MLENLLGGFIDKEKAIYNTIKVTLESVMEEENCLANELFIMIRPSDQKGNFKCFVYKNSKPVREITLKEIIGD